MIKLNENIWGHKFRVTWFKKFIKKEEVGLEFGSGTGIAISAQLLQEGYNIFGIDLDCPSIELGQKIFKENGLNPGQLMCKDLNEFDDDHFDYIIATEVFEHIEKADIDPIVQLIKTKLKPQGVLIITVPNGYGAHEIESLFWKGLYIKNILRAVYIPQGFNFLKKKMGVYYSEYATTIANSPHVRRFTWGSIKELAEKHEFEVFERRGSVLFGGGFSDMLFSGIGFLMKFNIWLGKISGPIASGFYLATRNKK